MIHLQMIPEYWWLITNTNTIVKLVSSLNSVNSKLCNKWKSDAYNMYMNTCIMYTLYSNTVYTIHASIGYMYSVYCITVYNLCM